MLLEFISEIIDEIITDSFTHPTPINYPNESYITTMNNDTPLFTQYKTLLQGGNNLCGFYSLFNLIHFIKYKNTNDLKHLKSMNSRWKFWSFYKKTVKRLLNELTIEPSGKKSLLSNGPLERYQLIYLIKTNKLFTSLTSISTSVSIPKLMTFFYGFGLFQCPMKGDIKNYQHMIDEFILVKPNKDHSELFVVLLGILNHWNVLVIEKNYDDSGNDLQLHYHFIDSRNIPLLNISYDDIESYARDMIDYLKKYNRVPSEWWRKCYAQWIYDMKNVISLITEIFKGKLSLLDLCLNNILQQMLNSFEEYNHITLTSDNGLKINDKRLFFHWIKQEYHPNVAQDELIDSFDSFNYKAENIRKILLYDKFIQWISIMDQTINDILNDTDIQLEDNEDKNIKHDNRDILMRYNTIIIHLKELINS